MKKQLAFIALFLCAFSLKSLAGIIYVDSANNTGYQDGSSFGAGYTSPQVAINNANAGDSIWVAQGTYQPTANTSYIMKEGVKIFGGFLNTDTSFAQRNYVTHITTLKGNGSSVISNANNGLTSAAVLDGFNISNGYSQLKGGGISDSLASPTINNCNFISNQGGAGGAVYSNSPLTMNNCTFKKNVGYSGGAIYTEDTLTVNSCTVDSNTATEGGGISSLGYLSINNSNIIGNTASSAGQADHLILGGGGIFINSSSLAYISNSTIANNLATIVNGNFQETRGGGIYCLTATSVAISSSQIFGNIVRTHGGPSNGGGIYSSAPLNVNDNSIIRRNGDSLYTYILGSTSLNGGGVYCSANLRITNHCHIGKNFSGGQGAGIYSGGKLFMDNCSIDSNAVATYGSGLYCTGSFADSISNCVFLKNTARQSGGGIYSESKLYLKNSIINADSAATGGGVYATAALKFFSCRLDSNFVFFSGAGIMSTDSLSFDSCFITNNRVINNTSYGQAYGGGISTTAPLNLNNSIFSNNKLVSPVVNAFGRGGAIWSNAVINAINCSFIGNKIQLLDGTAANVQLVGGGIYMDYTYSSVPKINSYVNCNFSGNAAGMGAGLSTNIESYNITNCTFTANKATVYGGGIYNDARSCRILNCIFSKDSAQNGGAICNSGNDSLFEIINTLFLQNNADSVGGAISNFASSPALKNCTIVRNTALNNGAAIGNFSSSTPKIINSIIWGNKSGIFNGDVNSIPTARYSLIQGFPASATSHLIVGTTNPLFIDTTGVGNYQLQSGSPCINVGRNDSLPSDITTDLAGNTRFVGSAVDMGAYEFGTTPLALGLINFTGNQQSENSVLLNWETANEAYSDFELQRSEDGNEFSTLYNVTFNASNKYSFEDNYPKAVNFYRLLMKGNGSEVYSNVILIKLKQSKYQTVMYPNPVKGNVNLVLGNADLLNSNLVITDVVGNIVEKLPITQMNQTVSLSGFKSGIYVIKLQDGETFKLIKE